jgi:hypothetical protein
MVNAALSDNNCVGAGLHRNCCHVVAYRANLRDSVHRGKVTKPSVPPQARRMRVFSKRIVRSFEIVVGASVLALTLMTWQVREIRHLGQENQARLGQNRQIRVELCREIEKLKALLVLDIDRRLVQTRAFKSTRGIPDVLIRQAIINLEETKRSLAPRETSCTSSDPK